MSAMADTLAVASDGVAPDVLLRPWEERDVPALVAAHRDAAIRRWLRSAIADEAGARQAIAARHADWQAGRRFSFAIVAADSGGLLGSVSAHGLSEESVSAEVGYWVLAAARGRGIAPRSLDALCAWVFRLPRARPLERLNLIHAVGNGPSCAVADKTGFVLSAMLPPEPPDFPYDGHLHVRSR
jgi:RimJ/RimL family protein N-acetyltransferase